MSAEPAEEGHQLISPTVPPVYWWAKHIELAVLQWESIFAKMHCSSERNQSDPLPWQWKVSVTQSQPQLWRSFFTLSLSTHFAQGYPIPLLQPCMYKLFSFGDQERSFSIISNCIQVSTKSHSNAGITQVNHMSPEYFLSFIKLCWIHRKQLWLKKAPNHEYHAHLSCFSLSSRHVLLAKVGDRVLGYPDQWSDAAGLLFC